MIRAAALFLLAAAPAAAQDGAALWAQIEEVLVHPRCANCHVGADNVPLWSDATTRRPHGMNVNAGESRIGAETMPCGTCHGPVNSPLANGPPGAEVWHLPPVEMQWEGLTGAAICAQIKDPALNGGRTLAEIAEHIGTDPLVLWGWEPGPGREAPPLSGPEVADIVRAWEAAGAPCPPE